MPEEPASATSTVPGFRILERIHESGPRVIYRARRDADGTDVVLKTLSAPYPRKREVAELRREFEIAQQLQLDGVVRVHGLHRYGSGNVAIEMEHFGISLAELMARRDGRPVAPDRAVRLGIHLARILSRVHENEVVHKDVVPRNVLIDPETDELRLIDFGISSALSRERQAATLSKRLEGSLPYLSPEQTGRMNRDLDYRSDYYSLGVTLFELVTGSLPFSAEDPLEWVHRHISQPPPAAHDVCGDVPKAVSRVLAKLLAKDAEQRYQSTFGLIADLERCRDELERAGDITPFEPGTRDVTRRFLIPQRLYGRDREMAQLRGLFDDVRHGATDLCLVSGYSGAGKSALVGELGKAIAQEKGYLIQGKFDQFQQSSAYGAFALAFRDLIHQLLGESQDRLESWREAIRASVGRNGQLLVDLVPELELILGPQPSVPDLPPAEAQNRFQILFVNFVKVFANERNPLVLFMDDLQWSDVPTLNLIQRLVSARELSHLLLVGAYRSNAVDATHPLEVALNEIRKTRDVTELDLEPLDREAVVALTADAVCRDREAARPLGELIHAKAEGNPFFVTELLKSLKEAGAISFDPDDGRWEWDLDAVRHAEVADNVIELLINNLRRLPPSTQRVLELASCIGSTFDLGHLAVIHEQSVETTSAELEEALRRNMVVPLDDSYRYVGLGDDGDVDATYRFQHDRVQQAAYALIDEDRRQAVHLSIGRLMQQHAAEDDASDELIEIVGHLNAGRELILGEADRRELARLNLEAGLRAQRSSAYDSALGFFGVARELLPPEAWESDYGLQMSLGRAYQQCAYLVGDHEEAEAWCTLLLERARTPLEKAEILSATTRQYSTMGKMRESIESAIAGLSLLGVDMTGDPGAADVATEMARVPDNLGEREISRLIEAPEIESPEQRVAIRLLMEIFPAAFLSGSGDLFPYLVLKSVNLSLQHGTSPESAFAYAAYGMLLCGALDDPATGYAYGRLAVEMNERFDDIALKSRILYVYAMFVHHWSNHWSSMTPWFRRGIEAGYQSGDLLYLAYSAQDCIIWDPKLDLETASSEQRKYLAIVRDCEYRDSLDSGTLFLQMQLNFMGATDDRFSMNAEGFDEASVVAGMRQRRFMTGIANYQIYKAEIHYFYDDYGRALDYVRKQEEMVASSMSLPQSVRFCLVAFLTRAALLPGIAPPDAAEALRRLGANLRQMEAWAANCPQNFEHLHLLMRAELARAEGGRYAPLGLYEAAIAAAKTSEFRRDEAMANELAAKHLLGLGLTKAAEGYLRAARYLYYRWGARRKVEELERTYPTLLPTQAVTSPDHASTGRHVTTQVLDSASLDLVSVMKASQTISGEIVLDQLWKTTMQILLENAGGQRGYFVARQNDQLVIQARASADGELPDLEAPLPVQVPGEEPLLPASVINNVLRTGTPLVLNDATDAGRFASDPYIVRQKPLSLLCIPILRHGKFAGAIYMENNLTSGAFTVERVEVMKLLAAQAAISMENADLYSDQVRLTDAQKRFVPIQFLESLGHHDIARVGLGEYVAKEMSVMFADLRDFTPLSERLGPRAVIELLNRYFSRLGEPITASGGFIDSFNGDEIMALFGGTADQALAAGVGMWRALEIFNRDSVASGGPALRMGMGVNTGPLVLGTVGGQDRLKCGVVGDTVNTASRIEQLTKRYGAPFLIGEHTHQALQTAGDYSIRMIDRVAVKGKERAIELYEVLDVEAPDRRRAKEATRDLLERAMELYFERRFEEARSLFVEAASVDPEDPVLRIFTKRADAYVKQAPPSDWRGFETLTTK